MLSQPQTMVTPLFVVNLQSNSPTPPCSPSWLDPAVILLSFCSAHGLLHPSSSPPLAPLTPAETDGGVTNPHTRKLLVLKKLPASSCPPSFPPRAAHRLCPLSPPSPSLEAESSSSSHPH